MERTSITLVRHGETEWNVLRRLQGRQNSELTPYGLEQAELTAEALKNRNFDILYTSDLKRALVTAEIINRYHNLEVKVDSTLSERNFGVMEGLTREVLQDKFPEVYSGYMARKEDYQIPGGESLIEYTEKVRQSLQNIIRKYKGKRILIITHGGVLDCIMRIIFNYPMSAPRSFSIYNASINRISVKDDEWFLEVWGDISHQKSKSLNLEI